jgi:RNA-directed DNA polymerase
MKVPYGEGVATHIGPESCVAAREGRREALAGESAGWVFSREIHDSLRGADAVETGGRPHPKCRYCEARWDPAWSETPGMHRSISHGNRESPRLSAGEGSADRIGKSKDTRR